VRPIVIAAGGTGGHFFPAEALAASLIARGQRVVLMTDGRAGNLKSETFAGHEQYVLRGAGLAGRGIGRAAAAILSLSAGAVQARHILARLDAAAVVGFGGYPCVPPILASRTLLRRPVLVLHEQNAVLGRANRFLAKHVDLLALGFAETLRVPPGIRTEVFGNPVRPAIQALAEQMPEPADGEFHLLVTGGSLGARVFSEVVPETVARLPIELRSRLRVVQQCRPEDMDRVRAIYAQANVQADLAPFFKDMAARLRTAHLIIARAGASTCAEIAVAGRAAILVPLPSAIDDHQTANARALNGATVIAQADFTPATLEKILTDMQQNPAKLIAAAQAVRTCARPEAANDLADQLESLIARAETLR
jgi:UDP-N-acetylglucosamine--N-acetylmuramyl-(pentapeptide) pyrophosphoryl-undecaprenol N-acetylglucosamine transferase